MKEINTNKKLKDKLKGYLSFSVIQNFISNISSIGSIN